MVEELFPGSVSLVSEVDVYEGVVLWSDGHFDECHACLLWCSASFFDVALGAGTDNIIPEGLSAHTSWDNVVEREFAGPESLAAILAFVPIAGEDVSSIEFDVGSRQAVVKEQADDAWHCDVEIDGCDPIVAVGLELPAELADLTPVGKIVVRIAALLERDNLGQLPAKQRKCSFGPDYSDCHVMLVEHKHVAVQSGLWSVGYHCFAFCKAYI